MLNRSWRILRSGEAVGALTRHLRAADIDRDYPAWIAAREPSELEQHRLAAEQANWGHRPRISIVMPVYNPDHAMLMCAVDSIIGQIYPEWELLLIDDGSRTEQTDELLEGLVGSDRRIHLHRIPANRGIVEATNAGIAAATGDYVTFVDQDDTIAHVALYRVAEVINMDPMVQFIYSDEDRIDTAGRRCRPLFKPGWNPEMLRSTNCVLHMAVVDAALLRRLGGCRSGTDGAQDWDLAMRISETVPRQAVAHVPLVLYHWRVHPGSTAAGPYAKPAHEDRVREIALAGLARRGARARIEATLGGLRYRYTIPDPAPRVSIIIPTRDRVDLLNRCVASVEHSACGFDLEILIVDNGSREAETLAWLRRFAREGRGRILRDDRPFNYSALCNAGVQASTGDVVVLLNNDIEAISDDWLEELVSQACRPGVGLVGAALYYPDNTIQHAGVILGMNGVADRPHVGERRGYRGIDGNAGCVQEVGAVITACAAILRSRYDEVGGMEERLPVSCNDIDLCLRLRARGYAILWSPFAELYHRESASRGYANSQVDTAREADEQRWLAQRWPDALVDPYYNPNFARVGRPYSLAACRMDQAAPSRDILVTHCRR